MVVVVGCNHLLQDHRPRAAFVVALDKLLDVIDAMGEATAAAAHVLEDGWAADVVDDRLPVHRVFQVAEAIGHGIGGDVLVGQDHCARRLDAQLAQHGLSLIHI